MKFDTPLAFFAGDTDMARLFRHHDGSDSPVGPPEQWPQSLRSVVQLMLGSAFPMFVAWGSKLARIYNAGAAGFNLHLAKPFDPLQLTSLIAQRAA